MQLCFLSSVGMATCGGFLVTWCEWSVGYAQLIDCDRGPPLYDLGCDGGNFEGGILYIAENGIDLEADYPYLAKDGKCRHATLW